MVTGDVTINASPTSAYLGDIITFTGRVLIDGAPMAGLGVTIYLDAAPAYPVFLSGGETDANGYYNIKWTSNYTGNLPIYAFAAAYQGFASPTIIVTITEEPVGEPYTQITHFFVPSSLPAGSPIGKLTVVTRNAGTAPGYLWVAINSERYTEVAGSSYPTQVAPGNTFNFYLTLQITTKMPNENFTLTATNEDGTSYVTKTILLQVDIPTTLTITAPDKVGVEEKFNISGILYETEAGIPIPYQPINHSYNGRSLGGSTTGVDGDYLKEVSIPEAGTWTLKSEFPGTEALQTSRAIADAVVAATPIETALLIAGPITMGIALFIYGTM